MKICINIGSGIDYRKSTQEEKWINIDKHPKVKADLYMDFIKDRLPFDDNSIDMAICFNLMPHINYRDMYKIVGEVHRVLKKGGIFKVNAIHFSSRLAGEPAHCQAYSLRFMKEMFVDAFDIVEYYDFIQERDSKNLFEMKAIRFRWLHNESLLEGFSFKNSINNILSFLGTIAPNFCERVWCYWVGGFDLIEGDFVK